jgi:S1-C subfamily serine protease/predicted esterase
MLRQATLLLAAVTALGPVALLSLADDSLDDLQAKAIKAATKALAPSVVQIETSGGTDILVAGPMGTPVRKAAGPTTGLVVAPDGYVISSAFNFVNKPSNITVRVPGHKEGYIADAIATDKTRMLTLLKFKTPPEKPLAVPQAAPKAEFKVGQTALAMGKTLDPNPNDPPSVSVGILSAVGRIWGKAVQTDAKVAPQNYGGPLADLQGRVIGVLIPADPRNEGETAGLEWYDSGIGFAVPLEDINAVLPRLKAGTPEKPVVLDRGLLGITAQGGDEYGTPPKIATVAPESAADKGGIKVGDVVTEIDGKPIHNYAQVRHALGSKYDGDVVTVKVQRGNETKTFKDLRLTSAHSAYGQAILGILPMRDDPELGVEVRYVYPKGPADAAGVKAGDRIMKIGPEQGAPPQPFSGRDQLAALLASATPNSKVKIEVVRKDKKTETLTVTLGEVPNKGAEDEVPDKLPEEASKQKALEPRKSVPGPGMKPEAPAAPKKDDKKPETGVLQRKNPAGTHSYWVYVPRDYDPNVSYALVIWLHPVGKDKEKDDEDLQDAWFTFCKENRIILAGPHAENKTGWVPSESDVIAEVARDVMATYTVDRRRVVIHGMGVGGQMAFYLGFHNRDLVRGVAVTGAALATQAKEKVPNQPLAFFLHAGGKDPLRDSVAESRTKLLEQKYPVVYREDKDAGHQYLDDKSLEELVRWIDTLDQL